MAQSNAQKPVFDTQQTKLLFELNHKQIPTIPVKSYPSMITSHVIWILALDLELLGWYLFTLNI